MISLIRKFARPDGMTHDKSLAVECINVRSEADGVRYFAVNRVGMQYPNYAMIFLYQFLVWPFLIGRKPPNISVWEVTLGKWSTQMMKCPRFINEFWINFVWEYKSVDCFSWNSVQHLSLIWIYIYKILNLRLVTHLLAIVVVVTSVFLSNGIKNFQFIVIDGIEKELKFEWVQNFRVEILKKFSCVCLLILTRSNLS